MCNSRGNFHIGFFLGSPISANGKGTLTAQCRFLKTDRKLLFQWGNLWFSLRGPPLGKWVAKSTSLALKRISTLKAKTPEDFIYIKVAKDIFLGKLLMKTLRAKLVELTPLLFMYLNISRTLSNSSL